MAAIANTATAVNPGVQAERWALPRAPAACQSEETMSSLALSVATHTRCRGHLAVDEWDVRQRHELVGVLAPRRGTIENDRTRMSQVSFAGGASQFTESHGLPHIGHRGGQLGVRHAHPIDDLQMEALGAFEYQGVLTGRQTGRGADPYQDRGHEYEEARSHHGVLLNRVAVGL